ncbi:hydroxypyruvate isomerase family protein [Mesorhizobium sp. IMUNJ 23232]|uniref:hydroxypyruvate isomerase family protein n=1 Tax=Mesorhizobium sp. IMUNJ 23232 TaxID=3376064 RepID=UPI0037938360
MPKFSANLGFLWPDRPLLDRIDAAAAAGFRAIELHWPYATPADAVRQRCAAHGIVLLGINTPVGNAEKGDFGLGAQAGREAEFSDGFRQSSYYARAAGASSVHVMAGLVAPEHKARAKEVLIENLSFAAKAAPDLTLLLEPINQRDKPGYFYSTLSKAADIIGEVGAPNLKIMFDVYHVGVSEGDVLTRLERHLPQIGHVQIAAVPSRTEPDEGEIAYGAVFAALDRFGYAGWTGCEYKPRAGTDEGLAWVKALGVSL